MAERRMVSTDEVRERLLNRLMNLWFEVYLSERLEVDEDAVREAIDTELRERFVPALSDRACGLLEDYLEEEMSRASLSPPADPDELEETLNLVLEVADEVLQEDLERVAERAASRASSLLQDAIRRALTR
ncbi:hypothetical protein [Methanopyrus sp.]